MIKTICNNNRGVALLVTLTVISVLIVVTMELNRRARSTLTTVVAARNRISLSHMAASGVQGAMALLVQDKLADPPSGLDSIQEPWADPEVLEDLTRAIAFDDGTVSLSIVDELSKIQVNTMVKFPGGTEPNNPQMFLWDRFIKLFQATSADLPEIDPRTIVNSIKDWLDSGDDDAITGLNGAENDYYQSLDPPYACKNGPITHLDEMVLINGIVPELYYGMEGLFSISDYATTTLGPLSMGQDDYFSGKININTADLPVIAALLPEGSEILAPQIIEYRSEVSDGAFLHDLSNPNWYKNAPGCGDVTLDEKRITTFSDFFLITAMAVKGDQSYTVKTVVNRVQNRKTGKWECKVLNWLGE